jgi:hypothetical protein
MNDLPGVPIHKRTASPFFQVASNVSKVLFVEKAIAFFFLVLGNLSLGVDF